MNKKLVTIIGGTGFLGRYVVGELVQRGYRVQVIARNATKAVHLIPCKARGDIVLRDGDVARPKTLQGALTGSYAVVNLVGILYQTGRQRFSTLHAQCPERLAQMARDAGVEQFIQISAIGADSSSQSEYARSKATGEKAVTSVFPKAVIIRPSVIFGPEDGFFNKFASMAAISPFLPLIGGGKTKFQPVYAPDVAKVIGEVLEKPDTHGHIYELGGNEIFTFRDVLEYIMSVTNQPRCLIPLPFKLASIVGFFAEKLPVPPLTRDQVRLLKYDNVVSPKHDGFQILGIRPTPVKLVVPHYLSRFQPHAAKASQTIIPTTNH